MDGVHFERRLVPARAIGHKALAVNLSDLAAMGAAPRVALLSLGLPHELAVAEFDGILDGLVSLAERHRVALVGGNITRSGGPLFLDVTAVGSVRSAAHPEAIVGRGRRPVVRERHRGRRRRRARVAEAPGPRGPRRPGREIARAAARHALPDPRVRLGSVVARSRVASACIDTSDGLADAVHQLASSSQLGADVLLEALPFDPAVRRCTPTPPRAPPGARRQRRLRAAVRGASTTGPRFQGRGAAGGHAGDANRDAPCHRGRQPVWRTDTSGPGRQAMCTSSHDVAAGPSSAVRGGARRGRRHPTSCRGRLRRRRDHQLLAAARAADCHRRPGSLAVEAEPGAALRRVVCEPALAHGTLLRGSDRGSRLGDGRDASVAVGGGVVRGVRTLGARRHVLAGDGGAALAALLAVRPGIEVFAAVLGLLASAGLAMATARRARGARA